MTLREKQSEFVRMLADLIIYATSLGFSLTFPPDNTKKVHKNNSFHYKALAIDLNLFNEDGVYLETTDAHQPLGEFWESIGGTWGGRFKNPDGNHYSYTE